MEYVILLLIAILFMMEQILFAYAVLNKSIMHMEMKRKIGIIIVGLCEIAVVLATKSLDVVLGASYLFSGVLFFVLFETKFSSWIKDYLFTLFGVTFLEICFLFIYTKLGVSAGEKVTLCYSVTILILLSIILVLGKGGDNDISHWSKKIWIPFLTFLGESSILFSLYTFLYSTKQYPVFSIQIFAVIGFGIEILSVVWLLLYLIHCLQRMKAQNNELEKYSLEQRNYFLQSLQNEEETKRFRHDILNHLLQLQSYQRKGMYVELGIYLEQLMQNVQNLKAKKITVGNDIIDVILNYYLLNIRECKVSIEGLVANDLPITQTDLCSIIANLINNAVEATEKAQNPQIHIVFCQGKDFLKVQVENTYGANPKFDKNRNFITTKQDRNRHGYGTKIIKRIVKKYHGEYEMKMLQGQVSVCVILEISPNC